MGELEENLKLQNKILKLKAEHNALIFAHNYQRGEIQEIADVLGDSLDLAMKVRKVPPGSKIIYAAVSFMAEIAAMLNPNSKIYFPISDAKCPMANFASANLLKTYRQNNPNIPIILYINSTTDAKQYADAICTSSNAMKIVAEMQKEWKSSKVAFGPDKNLAHYIGKKTGIPMDILPPNGHCMVHVRFTPKHIEDFRNVHSDGKVIVHPECEPSVVELADFSGSTSAMFQYIKDHPKNIIAVGTEIGLIDRSRRELHHNQLVPLMEGATCYTMKKYTLEAIEYTLQNLEDESLQIVIPQQVSEKALRPVQKMFQIMENQK